MRHFDKIVNSLKCKIFRSEENYCLAFVVHIYNRKLLLNFFFFQISDFTNQITAVTIPVGGSGVINCSAKVPTGVQYSISKTGSCQKHGHLNNSQITTINGAKLSDGGTYRCELDKNGVKIEKYVYVNITGKIDKNVDINISVYDAVP